jgi:hypothetical protein
MFDGIVDKKEELKKDVSEKKVEAVVNQLSIE